jgi:hypothetical protein
MMVQNGLVLEVGAVFFQNDGTYEVPFFHKKWFYSRKSN